MHLYYDNMETEDFKKEKEKKGKYSTFFFYFLIKRNYFSKYFSYEKNAIMGSNSEIILRVISL